MRDPRDQSLLGPLFDLDEGLRRRDKARELVDRDPVWSTRCKAWVIALATGTRLTTDAISKACGDPECDPRAFGSLMTWLSTHKYVAMVQEPWVKSPRVSCHGRPKQVWVRTAKR